MISAFSFSEFQLLPVDLQEGRDIGFADDEPSAEIQWRKVLLPGSTLYFEEGDRYLWVIFLHTEPAFRRRGLATALVRWLQSYAAGQDKRIEWGFYTGAGEQYLRHVVERRPISAFSFSEFQILPL